MSVKYKSEQTLENGNRYYIGTDDKEYISCTTLLKKYEDSKYLKVWASKKSPGELERIRSLVTETGKLIHAQLEGILKNEITLESEDLLDHTINAYKDFYQYIEIIGAEEPVFYNENGNRFAGRYDQLVKLPEKTFLIEKSMDFVPSGLAVVDLKNKVKYENKPIRLPRTDKIDFLLKNCLQISAYAHCLGVEAGMIIYSSVKSTMVLYLDRDRILFYWKWFHRLLQDFYDIKKLELTWGELVESINDFYHPVSQKFENRLPQRVYRVPYYEKESFYFL